MDKIYEQTLLLDFYSGLLTEKQREICRMHWQEDWSLAEISQELGISRQGVSDSVARARMTLEKSEEQLHMCERFICLKALTQRLEMLMQSGADTAACLQVVEQLKEAIEIRN